MTQALPPAHTLAAPASNVRTLAAPAQWQHIDFISDLHLHESEPANFLAWRRYLESTPADAVFVLGDLFEVWVGDDILRSQATNPGNNNLASDTATPSNLAARHQGLHFEDRCARVLHHAARHKALYFMHGNRDFLLGNAALQTCGMQLLADPTVLEFAGLRYLLSHGDALCLGDTDYQSFRAMVRSDKWQQDFFKHPLQERLQIARKLRAQSEARKLQGGAWVDLDPNATVQWMNAANAHHMIHGHTHEGVDHPITSAQGTGVRHVLCDWHADAQPPRAQVLRLSRTEAAHSRVQRLPLDAATAR
jgi:UDP-2,3-diacylglucosamine hydrolase